MIDGLKPYPALKDSGVEWLGQVPEHWKAIQIKRAYDIQLGKMLQNVPVSPEDMLVPYFKALHVQWSGVISKNLPTMWASPRDLNQYGVCPGDLLVCEGGEGGRCAIVKQLDGRAIIQNALHRVRPCGQSTNEFLQLTLRAIASTGWFEALNNKATIAHFTREKFAALQIALPPLPEQTAIVRFLDWAERRIRRVIRARKRRIKLLEEFKQALIHQAVTGRIDVRTGQPYPAYKPSGVEWLGEVPAHWEVVPLRWFISIASGDFIETSAVSGNRSDERLYPVIGGNGVMGYAGVYNSTEITVVVGRVGALCGNVHIVNEPAWITDNALMITSIRELSQKFLSIQLEVMDLNRLANANAQPLVTGGMIKAQRVVKPPIHEQLAIVDFVEEQTAKIDATIAADRKAIDLLQEFRTRLIADVVTGKLDVREAAAKLPDEPPEEEEETVEDEGTNEEDEVLADAEQGAVTEEGEP